MVINALKIYVDNCPPEDKDVVELLADLLDDEDYVYDGIQFTTN